MTARSFLVQDLRKSAVKLVGSRRETKRRHFLIQHWVKLWISLQQDVVEAKSLQSFKKWLDQMAEEKPTKY